METVETIGMAALAFGILRLCERLIEYTFKRNRNGSSGDKDPAYWEKTFREIVEEVMERRNLIIRSIVDEAVDRKLDARRRSR